MGVVPGARLGPYEVVAPIGSGGMGLVYRARDTRLGRDVAVKVLPHHLTENEKALARFEREARAVAALSHPNILSIFDVGREGTTSYAVTELLEGRTLRERLADGPLPARKAVEYAIETARGLAAAHDRGIIHRDLKPENLFVTREGRVKILDFGLAQWSAAEGRAAASTSPTEAQPTEPGTVLGTVGYMAPEQARGEEADVRSDLFSLGAILYETLTGQPAFRGQTAAETFSRLLRDDPPPLAVSGRVFSAGLELIVNRCLEKDPAHRFRSAHDLALALTASLGQPSLATQFVVSGAAKRLPRLAALLLAVVFGAAVTLGVLGLLGDFPPRPQLRYDWFSFSGYDRSPAVSPEGGLVAFASDRDGTNRIWIKQTTSSQGEEAKTEGPDDFPRFSPNGAEVLFARLNEGALYSVTTVGNTVQRRVPDALFGDWSPDGSQIAFIRSVVENGRAVGSTVMVINADGSSERELARVDFGLQHPRWSPDRSTVAAVSVPQGSAVRGAPGLPQGEAQRIVFAKADGSRSWTQKAPKASRGISSVVWTPDSRKVVYSVARSVVGAAGSDADFVRQDVESGRTVEMAWSQERASVIDVLADNQIVFDTRSPRQNLVELRIDSGSGPAAHWLTRGHSADRQPVYAPDGNHVVISSNRFGSLDLWRISTNGLPTRLTTSAASEWDPAFTDHGEKLLYSSDQEGHFECYLANSDGTGAVRITNDGFDAQNPTATPDGRWVVYASGNPKNPGLWKVQRDGTSPSRLVADDVRTPAVSPDGQYVLYRHPPQSRASRLSVVRLDDGRPVGYEIVVPATRLTEVGLGRARWMPDGRRIAFIGQDSAGLTGVYVQDFVPGRDTSASRRPLGGFDSENATESFDVSPDGTRLVISGWVQVFGLMKAYPLKGLRPPRW